MRIPDKRASFTVQTRLDPRIVATIIKTMEDNDMLVTSSMSELVRGIVETYAETVSPVPLFSTANSAVDYMKSMGFTTRQIKWVERKSERNCASRLLRHLTGETQQLEDAARVITEKRSEGNVPGEAKDD